MPDKDDKAHRKELLHKLREEGRQKIREAFPAPVSILKQLFDHLDQELSENGCDDTLHFAREFIARNGLDEPAIVSWLEENGGHCDCEALNNVEQIVLDAMPDSGNRSGGISA